MDGELTHDIIDNVLETLQAYCACRDDCKDCQYSYRETGDHVFSDRAITTCALRSIPAEWKVEQIGGKNVE